MHDIYMYIYICIHYSYQNLVMRQIAPDWSPQRPGPRRNEVLHTDGGWTSDATRLTGGTVTLGWLKAYKSWDV